MPDSIDLKLLSRARDYVDGGISLGEFRDWFLRNALAPSMSEPDDSGKNLVVAQVDLFLIELANGSFTEEDFRSTLRGVIQQSIPSASAH